MLGITAAALIVVPPLAAQNAATDISAEEIASPRCTGGRSISS
jgi:hypothetical protein